ncbi:MAG: T9SS type A sorting domain-containing protein [Bacteroidetes bacterium]|nr:T9SS type A sorting domain-containing protein [Bacteroidota bacterium]
MKFIHNICLIFGIFTLVTHPVKAIYVPVAVSGFNADVVADVQFDALGSTNADFDGVSYVLMSQSYNPMGTSYMPTNNIVTSVIPATPGLTYNLAPYTANNSLRLSGATSGTLTFNTPQSASQIFVLGATGSGTASPDIIITFTDLTTQVFPAQLFLDWFFGAGFAIQGMGRTLRTTNVITNSTTDPRLYQVQLDLLPANYGKQIQSVTFNNTGAFLNVMGISINTPPAPYDPAVTAITSPAGNCFTATQTITANVCNFGSATINLGANPIAVTLKVIGPLGTNFYSTTLNSGLLTPAGSACQTAVFSGVNMYAGGTYLLNTSLVISGLPNAYLSNDSLSSPITKINFRPTAGPTYQLCQYCSIPFGQGLTVGGCATPINDSVTIQFTITGPCVDNVGSTAVGTSVGPPSNCADQYACNFANGILPILPAGASFITPSVLTVTHLSTIPGSFANEVRMNIFGSAPIGAGLYAPGLAGSTGTGSTDFTYSRTITGTTIGNIYSGISAGGTVNLGYWESFNDNFATSDIGINGGGNPTMATLKIYYQYVPASFSWFNVPSGGSNLYNFSPFDPISTPGSGLSNSNTVGTSTFYAACSGSPDCRIPVNLQINPTPLAFQDTLVFCEYAVGANSAIFDLTTMNGPVSAFDPLASVSYFNDEALFSPVPIPNNDTSSTNFVYVKVAYANGCFSKDSLLLNVNSLPEFPNNILTGFACIPSYIDVASLINPFSTVPPGTDTLYYNDATYTTMHPNPHMITNADTVYVVFATNSIPVCSDTATAYVDVAPLSNFISGQNTTTNISMPGYLGCNTVSLTDGQSDTIRSTMDCKRVAAVTDILNGTSLGTTTVCEDISSFTPYHNGQPYANRSYEINVANSDTAIVCLYYLDEDIQQYNTDAILSGWPLLPSAATFPLYVNNIAITKVHNGDLFTPGHIASSIPSSSISASYDATTTVWTICFPVSGFSHFYLHSRNPFNIPLPVSMLNFTGKRIQNQSLLEWQTSHETNNHFFIVERSKDAIHFETISEKIFSKSHQGNSASPLDYQFIDQQPFSQTNYYRLQQHDIDGQITYSKMVQVYFDEMNRVQLYPNPVMDNLQLSIFSNTHSIAKIRIAEASGKLIKTIDFNVSEGVNSLQINLQDLASGVYLVTIFQAEEPIYKGTIRK